MLDRSTESIDSVAEDDILLSTSLSLEQCRIQVTSSDANKTTEEQSWLIFYDYVSCLRFAANKNLFI